MKIIEMYRQIFDFAGLSAEDDRAYIKEIKEPYLVNGQQLVLPTSNLLRNFKSEDMVVFHPLSEDIIKGETPVINKLRYTINIRINIAIGVLTQSLLNLVNNSEYHKGLSPEQSELLYTIKEVDDKTVKSFTTYMMKEVSDKEDKLFSYIYLKRGGSVNDTKYARVAIASFPFYQTLVKGEKYKFRTKDIDAYIDIFRFIFPNIEDIEEYNSGSNSEVAPFFDSLLRTSYKITSRLNDLINIYERFIDQPDSIRFNLDWIDTLNNISEYKNEIRSIPVTNIIKAPEQTLEYPKPEMQYHQMPQQPMVQQQPALKETNRGLDFNSLKQKMNISNIPNAFIGQPGMMPMQQNMVPMQPRNQPYLGDILNRQQPTMMPMQYPAMQSMIQQGQPMYGQPMMPMQGQPMMQQGMMPMQYPAMQPMMQQGQPMFAQPMMPPNQWNR